MNRGTEGYVSTLGLEIPEVGKVETFPGDECLQAECMIFPPLSMQGIHQELCGRDGGAGGWRGWRSTA